MKAGIPVKKNEYYNIDIHGLGHEGEGVGRIDGFTVFVPYAVPGDTIKVKILKVKSAYAYGKLVDIIDPSEYRIDPICPLFVQCGGCQLQHVDYGEQLRLKRQKVVDALQRIGRLEDIVVHPTLGMDKPVRYRNKAQFPVAADPKDNSVQIGFYAPRSHRIVEIDTCHIQHEMNDVIVDTVKQWMKEYHITAYHESTGKGLVRHIFTRIAFKTGEVMVVLVTNGRHIPNEQSLIHKIKEINTTAAPVFASNAERQTPNCNIVSMVQNINTRKTNVVLGQENRVLWGKDTITDYIGDVKFNISPMSFYQVNPVQTEVLYNKALEYAGLTGDETVFDLYCGIGTISLFLAQRAKKVIGVEIVPAAIEDAKKNASINDIRNVAFYTGAAEEVVPELYGQGHRADVVVIDPPRKGCDETLLSTIAAMQAERIVYVSCNPSTLARDLRFLEDQGYKVVEVQPVDLFCWTYHVEVVVGIRRKESMK